MNAHRFTLLSLVPLTLAWGLPAEAAELADEYDCLVEARTTAEIRSPIEGLIEQVHVKRGDFVRKGQVVVTLESGPERAALALARSKATMKGPLEASASRLDFAIKKEQRAAELYKQKFVSAGALDEARTQRELAESELKEARENQKLNELEMQRAEEVVKLRTIRSPFNGVVVERYLSSGEFATANVKNPILKLAEVDPLNVEVVLPASIYGKIRIGTRAKVSPEAPGGEYSATVVLVDRVIDAASGTFGVRLELPNGNQQIPAGAKCRVKFPK
jgi:RND family efflux transporter MFP subunit